MSNNRIDWVDMAKGYGMILVIYGHIIFNSSSLPLYMIFSFHMPLFFFLSGYFISVNRPFTEFIKKKNISLLRPAYTYGLIIILFQICMMLIFNTNEIYDFFIAYSMRLILQYRFVSLWFLSSLWVASYLFYIVAKGKYLFFKVLLITLIGIVYYTLGGKPLAYNVDTAPIALFFIYTGHYYHKHNIFIKHDLKYLPQILALILFIAGNYYIYSSGYDFFDINRCSYPVPLLSIPLSFTGIYLLLTISKLINFNFVKFIGRNTIIFLGLHNFVIMPILQIFIKNDFLLLFSTIMAISFLCFIRNSINHKVNTYTESVNNSQ